MVTLGATMDGLRLAGMGLGFYQGLGFLRV